MGCWTGKRKRTPKEHGLYSRLLLEVGLFIMDGQRAREDLWDGTGGTKELTGRSHPGHRAVDRNRSPGPVGELLGSRGGVGSRGMVMMSFLERCPLED